MYTVTFLPVLYTIHPLVLKTPQSILSSTRLSLFSSFLLYFPNSSLIWTLFRGLNGSNLSALWTLWLRTCLVVNEDVLDVDCSVAVVDTLCCNWVAAIFPSNDTHWHEQLPFSGERWFSDVFRGYKNVTLG